jgi:hypothetical protein
MLLLHATFNLYRCMTLAIAHRRLSIVVLLTVVSVAIVAAIPWAAARGKLHMAGYIGIAFAAFAAAMILGKISGIRGVSGTLAGLLLSFLFFFAIATVLGSLAALMFYKPPKDPTD